jgi:hypothetical protein
MSERVNPFANLAGAPVFTTKPKAEKSVEEGAVARLAEDHNFPSRQAPRTAKSPAKKDRRYRTGRNVQFNAKVTQDTSDRIYRIVDNGNVPIGEVLRLMVEALEEKRAGGDTV